MRIEDAVPQHEALSAILQKKGLPPPFANRLAASVCDEAGLLADQPETRSLHILDIQIPTERVNGTYCVSREDLARILDSVQPDPSIVAARDAGADFKFE